MCFSQHKRAFVSVPQEVEALLAHMTLTEKAQLLLWVVRDLGNAFPGIDSKPDVSDGEVRIVRTRIPVWLLGQARQLGSSEPDLLRAYPSLRAEDLANARSSARAHHDEIMQQIHKNELAC